ncbi:adenylate/guanylate cyclase domain-containing protein [Leptospira sp. GIMC2001]|uniref:adenylate/guanylate cyclase domain-containing protein n=1 Tax=Leptospira sp. GIMC2001 TaxID=1513297 RepID=UPI0023495F7B|nr:adenylate/guanylate cyclase domain-containing protein [Leptospira sp. GIMC2001]WCL49778.1 adenylate/guanylate cyclase domain-containing protein [Leptospira sp. GIMC2001]
MLNLNHSVSDKTILLDFENLVQKQINKILQKGSLVTALLGFTSSIVLYISVVLEIEKDIFGPILWAFIGGIYSIFVHFLARKNLIKNRNIAFVMLGFAFLPSVIYIYAFFYLPAGTATYLSGPPSYLYFFLIIVTGFAFDFHLSVVSGLFCAVQYTLIIILSLDQIELLVHPDFLMQQDLKSARFYFFRPLMMAVSGFVVGVLGRQVRQLIAETIDQEKEKSLINRLFGLYVSPEVREKVVSQKTGNPGERKFLAILFCDIRDFTKISENKQPEDLVTELNEYLDEMASAISSESGTIDKFIGDAVMAVFGGAIELEYPCDHALRASIKMQENLKNLNIKRKSFGLEPLKNGIGLNYGEVFIGPIGSSERKDFTVIGDAVNTTSRIEAECKNQNVSLIFSKNFYDNLTPSYKEMSNFIGTAYVKGKKEEVLLYGLS